MANNARWSVLLLPWILVTGCSGRQSSTELEAELRQMQESEHVYIGFVDNQSQVLNLMQLDGHPDGGTRQLKLTTAQVDEIRADNHDVSFSEKGDQPSTSPDGKRVIREQEHNLVLDEFGQGIHRVIVSRERVIGKVHWSPNSMFLMYLERASKWDSTALRALDNVVYVTVYRCRDGQKGQLKWFGEGAAAAPWEWLLIRSELVKLM